MAKVMVSLPDDVLRAVDAEADRRGLSRSGLLRQLAEESLRQGSIRRAARMAEINVSGGRLRAMGGRVGDLVKATRPEC
ncbi:MAG: ribbon-helix-helix protein, CopG family [Acidimicrobiales bacterium]